MKPDWRDTVRVASDVAVLGLLVVAASLPIVTIGAALATASGAVHHFLTHDRWPRPRAIWSTFRRAFLPGALATAVLAVAVALVILDLAAVSSGRVPGGGALVAATTAIAAVAAGYAALALVALGSTLATTAMDPHTPHAFTAADSGAIASPGSGGIASPGSGQPRGAWLAAGRAAGTARLAGVAAAAGVVALAGLLAVLVHPILAACLVGYAVYALHVVTRRLTSPVAADQDEGPARPSPAASVLRSRPPTPVPVKPGRS